MKKIAFEITSGVPATLVKGWTVDLETYMLDVYDVTIKLKDNPKVLELMEKGAKKFIEYSIGDLYVDDILDPAVLQKLFKVEIKEAEAKRLAADKAERQARDDAMSAKTKEDMAKKDVVDAIMSLTPAELARVKKILKDGDIIK